MTAPFTFPATPHTRRHGPGGYADYESYRPWLRDEFAFRCVFCLTRETWGSFLSQFAIDHFVPVATKPDSSAEYANLLYSCVTCNGVKGSRAVPDPVLALLDHSIRVAPDGVMHAQTTDAARLVELLDLNDPRKVEFRSLWIAVVSLSKRLAPELHLRLVGSAGAEVVVGDLLEPADVYRVLSGCRRVYFGMSVSAGYLEATVTMAAVAREVGVDALVNMSQMTVSQMSIQNTTPSPQQRQHWLSEQALAWSGLPVVTIRPTAFLEGFFLPLTGPSVRDRGRIELPFGRGKTNPVAAADVARVVAAVLADPGPHLGRIYELTGPRSQDMHGVVREYSDALNREVTYSDIPPEDWERELKRHGLPEHLTRHLVTMAELNRAGRYDRLADGVERVTGRPAMSVREFVSLHADEFGGRRS